MYVIKLSSFVNCLKECVADKLKLHFLEWKTCAFIRQSGNHILGLWKLKITALCWFSWVALIKSAGYLNVWVCYPVLIFHTPFQTWPLKFIHLFRLGLLEINITSSLFSLECHQKDFLKSISSQRNALPFSFMHFSSSVKNQAWF